MVSIDVIDETFVVADPGLVRAALCEAERWQKWFPGLRLSAYHDRGPLGVRWVVSGALVGTAEVWLQQYGDGVVVHVYFRCAAGPAGLASGPGLGERAAGRRLLRLRPGRALVTQRAVKARVTAVKDALEGDRQPAEVRVPLAERAGSRPGPAPASGHVSPAVDSTPVRTRPQSASSVTSPRSAAVRAGPWSAYGPAATAPARCGAAAEPDRREVVGEGLAAASAGRRSGADG